VLTVTVGQVSVMAGVIIGLFAMNRGDGGGRGSARNT